jgi:putative autotransporter adhesin-like protein
VKRILFTLVSLFALPATSAFAETRSLNFRDFTEVSVGSGMRVSISQGRDYRVEATGEANDLQRLKVNQSGERLEFFTRSSWFGGWHAGPISLDITLPSLRELNLSGGARGNLNEFTVENFSASLSGGSQFEGKLNSGDIDLTISGGSRIALSGAGKRLRVEGSGGSRCEARDLTATDVKATLSGGSFALVNTNGELDAVLSGGARVTYYGNARLGSIVTSGGSRVQQGT